MKQWAIDERWLEGFISLQRDGDQLQPWRLPVDQLPLYPPAALAEKAAAPSGVRLRFVTDSRTVTLAVEPATDPRPFDLVVDEGEPITATAEPVDGEVRFEDLPPGTKRIELWLGHRLPVRLRALGLDEAATVEPVEDGRPRWVHYGSSISHGGSAGTPTRTWPATVARLRRLHLTNLGFGGNCHLEPMLARLIRDLPADAITLKVGINIQGACSLSERTFVPALIGFVRTIRERHPRTPIGVISPIYSPPRETQENPVGLSLVKMREQLADAVARLRGCGDEHVHYFDGLAMFGPGDAPGHLPDDLHPNDAGYAILAGHVAERVMPRLGL